MAATRLPGTRNTRHIAEHPYCVYCGGTVPAVQVDHVPPISVFTLRRRPEGLEFSACAACHEGTRPLDAVAAYYSRLFPDPVDEAGRQELTKLQRGMFSVVPGIQLEIALSSSLPPDTSYADAMTKNLGPGVFLRVFPPTARLYLDRFAARVALALHYRTTGIPLHGAGAIYVRTMTNTALTRGDLPPDILQQMGDLTALYQKGLRAQDDFSFVTQFEQDVTQTVSLFRLRKSMGALTFCLSSPRTDGPSEAFTEFRPGFLKELRKR